ncbi:MAG: tetratricopeptide repeat protein [Cyclobacteriaceae bacterium]|nr:tetratricopeptide repeat protein [Cyclobacteriaceae bacterium]
MSEENRKKAKGLLDKGHTAYNEENYQKAIGFYTEAIAINPNYDDAFYWRANVHYALKNYREALPDYSRAIELNPNNEQAYYYRALSNYYLEAYPETLPDFDKAIELNPDVASMYNWRGEVNYRQKQYEEAIFDYSKSIELNKMMDTPSMAGPIVIICLRSIKKPALITPKQLNFYLSRGLNTSIGVASAITI